MTPDCPSLEAQAYELLLMCRLHYETPGETEEFVGMLARLVPAGGVAPMDLPAAAPAQPTTPDGGTELLYRRALAVWAHPEVASGVRVEAYRFLLRYLAQGRASAGFVASVSDEAMLMIARARLPSEDGNPGA